MMMRKHQIKQIADRDSKRQRTEEDLSSLLEAVKKKSSLDSLQKIIDLGVSLEEKDDKGKTALMYAVINDDPILSTILICAGADVEAVDSDGFTVLMHAVLHTSSCDLLDSLLKKGAQISHRNNFGYTALLLACESGGADLVTTLVNNGASSTDKNKQKESALMLATERNCLAIMKILLSTGAKVNFKDDNDETALFRVHSEESFFLLLEAGANPSVVNVYRNSVLMNIVKHNPELLNCIKHLLKTGSNPYTLDNNGNNLLTEACKHPSEQLDLVKLLLEQGINPSSENQLGLPALSFAISRQHVETIKLLLSSGASPCSHDKQSLSLLMQLCRQEVEVMDIFNLLIEAGANLTAQDINGQSVLMFAINRGHSNYIKRLLQLGVNPSGQSRKGTSALMQVCNMVKENLELVNILLEAGASTLSQNINGETALMVAVEHKHLNIVELLLKNGAKMCTQNRYGQNVLMMACEFDEENIGIKLINLFLKYGVNLSAQDSYESCLSSAMHHGNHEIVKLLIEAGANIRDILIQDLGGCTLLMKACESGLIDIVKMLIKKGARIETQNNDGDTAVILAACEHELEVMFLLLDSGACSVYKNNSVIFKIFENIICSQIDDQEFKDTLKKVLEYNTEIDSSLIVYEMVRSYLDNISNDDTCCWKLALSTITQFVEESSIKLKESNISNCYQSDIHELLMDALASTCQEDDGIKFNCTIQLFDVIMKSPFKDVNWSRPISTCLEPSVFSCINGEFVPCETVGFLIYTCRHDLSLTTKLEILLKSVQNLLNNGFSTHSKDDRFISPLTILMSLLLTSPHHEEYILEIFKLLLNNGVSKCQRLLRFPHEDHILLSQQLQLPDALWFAFTNSNLTMLPHLLPYWSAPPIALLSFVPQLSPLMNGTIEDIDDDTLKNVVNKVLPTLVEIGGPLPPGHVFIPTIQSYLETLVAVDSDDSDEEYAEDAVKLSENFRELHSRAPPSLKQLCRHVIRGCAQTGDDLPQHLSSLVPPGLRSYLTLMDYNYDIEPT